LKVGDGKYGFRTMTRPLVNLLSFSFGTIIIIITISVTSHESVIEQLFETSRKAYEMRQDS
jgi:hypothetical protein